MNKKTMLWSTTAFLVGGAESYIMRMFQWAHKRNYRNVLILEENAKIDSTWEAQLKECNVEVYYHKEKSILALPKSKDGVKLFFEKKEKVLGFATFVKQFENLRYVEMRFPKTKFRNYFYILHPWNTRVQKDAEYLKKIYKYLIYKDICENNQLLFMDLEYKNYFEEYYNLVSKTEIMQLGLDIKKLDEKILYERENKRNKVFTILTIGRFDFPAKAYILNAIDTYAKLKEKYGNIQLKIIGYGEGEKKVKNKIKSLDKEKQKDVILVGKVAYEQLEQYMDEASVLIAEGTCTLDGAARGLISSVDYAYQAEGKSAGLFHEQKTIGAIYNRKLESYLEVDLIEQVYEMHKEEYIASSKETYQIYYDEYDINKIMSKIKKLHMKRTSISGFIKLFLCDIICKMFEY